MDGTILIFSEPNAGELPLFMYLIALSFQLLGKNLLAIRTTGWLEGEVVEDGYEIPVDPAAPSGEYLIEVGLYDAAQPGYPRLPVLDEQGQVIGDRVLLREVRIKP